MLAKIIIIASAMLLSYASMADNQELPPNNCLQTESSISPRWYGAVVCDVGGEVPSLTVDEWNVLRECLESNEIAYDIGRLAGWKILWAKDLIAYPTTAKKVTTGLTNVRLRHIFIRSNLPQMYGSRKGLKGIRVILAHEIMHVILLDPIMEHHPPGEIPVKAYRECDPKW